LTVDVDPLWRRYAAARDSASQAVLRGDAASAEQLEALRKATVAEAARRPAFGENFGKGLRSRWWQLRDDKVKDALEELNAERRGTLEGPDPVLTDGPVA